MSVVPRNRNRYAVGTRVGNRRGQYNKLIQVLGKAAANPVFRRSVKRGAKRLYKEYKRYRQTGMSGGYTVTGGYTGAVTGGKSTRKSKRQLRFERAVRKASGAGPTRRYFEFNSGQVTSALNSCKFNNWQVLTTGDLEALMTKYQYVNSAGVTSTLDMAALHGVRVEHIQTKKRWNFKNNSTFKAKVHAYWCLVKDIHNVSPASSVVDGLDDNANSDAGWELQPNMYPQHSKIFNENWRVAHHEYFQLAPGEDKDLTFFIQKQFTYSPDSTDSNNSTYQRKYCGASLMLRVEGETVHDTTDDTLVGIGQTALDWVCKSTIKFRFINGRQQKVDVLVSNTDSVAVEEAMRNADPQAEVFSE